MATVEELDRLRAIVTRLGPLASAQAGELIRAEDWNDAIGALQEVARALVEDREAPVPPHEHPDQVAIGWLDPRLRQLVESGPVGDPAALARVGALERADEGLRAALDAIRAELDDVRTRSRDIATRDLDRQAAVNVVRRKLEGVADAREDVAAVRSSLAAVHDRVTRAVELAEKLQDGGEPVDLGALSGRVAELAKLREGLTLPSGEVLDAPALERKLAELRNELVTQDELDEALEDRTPELPPEREQALKADLTEALKADFAERDDAVRDQVAKLVDDRLAAVDEKVAKAVADARPGIVDSVLTVTRQELDARAAVILTTAGDDADARVKAGTSVLREQLLDELAGLRKELPATIAAELDAQLPARLAPLTQDLAALRGELDGVTAELKSTMESLSGALARIDELDRSTAERFDRLSEQLKLGLSRTESRLNERITALDARVTKVEGRTEVLDTSLDPRINELLDARDEQLRTELSGLASDQVAGLEDRLPVLIGDQVVKIQDTEIRNIAVSAVEDRLRLR